MEESKEGGVLVGSVSESLQVAGDDTETLVESMDTEVQGQGQTGDDSETLVESMDTEVRGQDQAGDDSETLVESMDTEVRGQGQAGDDSETVVESMDTEVQGQGQIEGSSIEDVLEEGELCDDGDVKGSGGDVSGLGTETGLEDSSMLSDPSQGQNQGADVTLEEIAERENETTDDKGVITDDKGSMQVESINDKARDDRIGTHSDGTAEAVSSTEVESQNQAVEVVAREGDANEIVDAQAVGGEEAHSTKESANVKGEEFSIGILAEEVVDRTEVVDDGVDVVQDIKMPEADNPDNGIHNSVTETKVGEHNQASEEEAAASAKQKEAEGGSSLDGIANNSNREYISVTKGVCGEPEREAVNSTGPGSLDEHKIVFGVDRVVVKCSKVEGMDIDALNENLYFTFEELTSHDETNSGSTENHCNLIADFIPLSQPVQVTSGLEIAAVDDKELSNSQKEGLDQSMAHDDTHVDSKLELPNDFDKQVTQAKQVGFHEESETELQQRQSKAETVNGDSGIHCHVLVDATSGQSSPVVVGDKIVVNSIPSVEISDYVDMDEMLKEQNLTAETLSGGTVADAQVIDGDAEVASQPIETEERVADSEPCVIQGGAVEGAEILGSGGRDQPLTSGETVDESAAHDHLEVNSNVGKEMKMKVVEQAIDEDEFDPDFKLANKRRAVDSFADDSASQEGRKTISFAKVSLTTPSTPKHSFKIGECIRRVAPSILKCNSEKLSKLDGSSDGLSGDGFDASLRNVEDAEKIGMIVPVEYSSLDEFLTKLHLVARDPFGGYEFVNVIASFFFDFRNSVVLEQYLATEKAGSKRGMPHPLGVSPETFEFEDMSDTYWTDRIIQNGSEEQPLRKSRKREIDPIQGNPRPYSRRRYSDSNDMAERKPIGYVGENAPAELVMNFSEVDTVPSEMNLNRMFKHFGSLKESETEVDKEASRARVVFKRCSDAEAAFSSAGKFGIFGPVAVNYQLNYTVLPPFRNPLVATPQGDEDTTLLLEY